MIPKLPFATQISLKLVLPAILLACNPNLVCADSKPDLKAFDRHIKPLLQKYCVQCHGGKTPQASIGLDSIDPDIITGEHFGKWEDVREAFNTGEMPPEDKPQPTAAERDAMTRWLDAEFKKAQKYGSTVKRGSVRRLTRYELRYALEDLLHTSVKQQVGALPEEGTSVETGLKNNSQLLMISSPHLEAYLNVILSIINRMKEITTYEPYRVSVDIENLNVDPPVTFADKGKRNKPPVAKVDRAGKGVLVNGGGYIDLSIPSISRYVFDTSIAVQTDTPASALISIGFQRSDVDPRQVVRALGSIDFEPAEELKTYTLRSWPDELPAEMTRALDRPFFIRITNAAKRPFYLEAFDYRGNNNTDLTSMLVPADIAESDIDRHIRRSIAAFLQKAFRRSPTESEISKYNAVYDRHAMDESPIIALLSTYKAILCSPGFFYLGMPGDLSEEAAANYRLAERLAFFLWCSVPDEQLLEAAATGKLTTPPVLAAQVDRMLADDKSRRFVEHFTDQWLQTSLLFNVAVDRTYYPRFKDPLKDLMRRETLEAVNDVFRNGSTALDFLKADHVFVNQALASFYQLKGVRGDEFRKVAVDTESHRGGLLTQGTFLVGNSDGMNSHAILRGVWLAETILNDPPPDPPANVPPLDESIPGFDKMTLNEKLFAHRNNVACRSCHQRIDPWGIPFENYDASGAWRDKVLVVSKVAGEPQKGKKRKRKPVFEKSYAPIDRESTLPDGVTVDGIGKLKDYLVSHRKRDFAKGLTERILACAISRDLEFHDEDLVNLLVDRFAESNYSVPTLIREIVQSEPFQRGY
jgi:hypothetical protein